MIPSTPPPDRTVRPDVLAGTTQIHHRAKSARPDQLSTASAAALDDSLARDPEIRPAEVARARALVSDPSYPSVAIMKRVAQQIVAAPDLSEDES
ncbi:MAG: hypothetical protein ABI222_11100 [Opitutaceae bacterium]